MTCDQCGYCRTKGEIKDGEIVYRCRSSRSKYFKVRVRKSQPCCEHFDWADPAAERFAAARHQ